ncbi:MAG: hypothetical protein WKG00_12585 [Polyangiaceae bacterium]
MKPGDHPDFYRVAPPPGTSRESTIVLDREGRFWHDGGLVEHAALDKAMRSWITRHPDDGRWILSNGYDWTYFRLEGSPHHVTALRIGDASPATHAEGDPAGAVTLVLAGGDEERLDPATLSLDDEGVVHARVKGDRDARFSRHAQTELAPLLEGDPPALRLGGRSWPIAPAPAAR